MDRFSKICKDIKEIKIQGAENVAKAALVAYSLKPNASSIKKLISLRKTEPMVVNALNYAKKHSVDETLKLIKENERKIIENVVKLIKNGFVVYTHCHSSTVTSILIKAHKFGKKFSVFNTETRPLFQGRKTAIELAKAGIKTTMIVDDAVYIALKKADIMLIGADALMQKTALNKIGSGLFAEEAFRHKVPVYIASNSWKFSKKSVKIEERNEKEVFDERLKILKVRNPAFEAVPYKFVKGIICELGIIKPKDLAKKIKKNYLWLLKS